MGMPTEQTRWRRSLIAETFASVRVSASCYRCAENIGVLAIVEAKLKFVQVEREIFFAHVMIGADHATFQQRPERFDAVCVVLAAHVLARRMLNRVMLHAEMRVGRILVGHNDSHPVLRDAAHETVERARIRVADDASHDISLAFDCSDDADFAIADCFADRLRPARFANLCALLVPVSVGIFPADICLVHFDDPHQLPESRITKSRAKPHTHIPSRAVRAGSDHSMDLQRANSFLAGHHQVQNLEPRAKRDFRFLEDRSGREREAIGRAIRLSAFLALPVPRARLARVHMIVRAAHAFHDAIRPAPVEQVRAA